jgi:hypothetical protein
MCMERELGVTTVTISTELREEIKNWRNENGCQTMYEAVFEIYQEATE